jgi:hypothetical protein
MNKRGECRATGGETSGSAASGGGERPTEPPPFDPEQYARDSESHLLKRGDDRRPTSPPTSTHEALRDSCQDLLAVVAAESGTRIPRREAALATRPTLGSVAVLLVAHDDLEWFNLEPLARTVLNAVDGETIVEDLLSFSRLDVAEGLAMLESLANSGLVAFGLSSSRRLPAAKAAK